MTLKLYDRIKETSASTGTTTITLSGAVTSFLTLSSVYSTGDLVEYTMQDQSGPNWEIGIGTYNASGNTLSRTTVTSSSNSGALVNFTSGALYVFVTISANRMNSLNNASNPAQHALCSGL